VPSEFDLYQNLKIKSFLSLSLLAKIKYYTKNSFNEQHAAYIWQGRTGPSLLKEKFHFFVFGSLL
jgi:hypothetical protein